MLLGARSAPLPANQARCDPTVPLCPPEAAGAAFTELAWAALFALPKLPTGSERLLGEFRARGPKQRCSLRAVHFFSRQGLQRSPWRRSELDG